MRRKKNDDTANAVMGIFWLIALPFIVIEFLYRLFTGRIGEEPETSQNFARQGSGGRFRRVTPDEVMLWIKPISGLVDQVNDLKARSGRVSPIEAEALIADANDIANKIDARCNDYERQNFSFAHRRNAEVYEGIIAEARKVADDLRRTKASPLPA